MKNQWEQKQMATSEGFEPPNLAFEARCSIQLSDEASIRRQISKIIEDGREICSGRPVNIDRFNGKPPQAVRCLPGSPWTQPTLVQPCPNLQRVCWVAGSGH